jgi:hypothetical protein
MGISSQTFGPKMPKEVMLQGFGGLNLLVAGVPRQWTNMRHLALLAYMRMEHVPHERRRLQEIFFPVQHYKDPAQSLSVALSEIRAAVGEDAVRTPRTGQVELSGELRSDVVEWVHAARRQEARRELVDVYGTFFGGFHLPNAEAFNRWVERKQTDLRRMFETLCVRVAEDAREQRDWEGLAAVASTALLHSQGWPPARGWAEEAQAAIISALSAPQASPDSASPPEAVEPVPSGSVGVATAGAAEIGSDEGAAAASPVGEDLVEQPPSTKPSLWRSFSFGPLTVGVALALVVALAVASALRRGPYDGRGGAVGETALCAPSQSRAELIAEVYKRGVAVPRGKGFTKGWKLQNVGACTWRAPMRLHALEGAARHTPALSGDVVLDTLVSPGESIWLRLPVQAPREPGTLMAAWRFLDAAGLRIPVGRGLDLLLQVQVLSDDVPLCSAGQAEAEFGAQSHLRGARVDARTDLQVSWALINTGDCIWNVGAALRFASSAGNRMSDPRIAELPIEEPVPPRGSYTFTLPLKSPGSDIAGAEEWAFWDSFGERIPIRGQETIGVRLRGVDVHSSTGEPEAPVCVPGQEDGSFVGERYLDGSVVFPGTAFVKQWTLLNNGPCSWGTGLRFRYVSHEGASRLSVATADLRIDQAVAPGAIYVLEVPMVSPMQPGKYREDWELVNARGDVLKIGSSPTAWADIVVSRP